MAVVKSADRVVLILEAIAESKTGLTHGEISKISGYPRRTACHCCYPT